VERSAETTRDDPDGEYLKRNRWFESGSLQRGVRCELALTRSVSVYFFDAALRTGSRAAPPWKGAAENDRRMRLLHRDLHSRVRRTAIP
jgi:hypothetical protein